jgi:hypothetical protein
MGVMKCELTEIVNSGTTAVFFGIAREVNSVYETKEEALRIMKY